MAATLTVLTALSLPQLPAWALPVQLSVFVLLAGRCYQLARRRAEFQTFPQRRFLRTLRNAHRRVRILDTYSTLFLLESSRRLQFLDGLKNVVRQGGRVEILLLDPRSPRTEERVAALRDVLAIGEYEERMEDNLRELYILWEGLGPELQHRFKVRLFTTFPGATCYQTDDQMLTSLYPPLRGSDAAPHLLAHRKSPVGQFVENRFTALWENAPDFLDHMRCRVEFAGRGSDHAVRADSRFIGLNGTLYLSLDDDSLGSMTDPYTSVADLTSGLQPIEVVMPAPDGGLRKRFRVRTVPKQDDLEHHNVTTALRRKYGRLAEGDTILALAHPETGAEPEFLPLCC
jgi:hypothetical protein